MSLRRSIEGLGRYPSLFLLALPTATVEPLKLVAVAVAGKGHWVTGTAMSSPATRSAFSSSNGSS
jgi:hypothetical protein